MTDVLWPAEPVHRPGRLHQPWRVVVATLELVLAVTGSWVAVLFWGEAVTTITVRLDGGAELVSRHLAGNWVAAAVGLATVAGFLLLDAVRQLLLGLRTRRRRKSRERPART